MIEQNNLNWHNNTEQLPQSKQINKIFDCRVPWSPQTNNKVSAYYH